MLCDGGRLTSFRGNSTTSLSLKFNACNFAEDDSFSSVRLHDASFPLASLGEVLLFTAAFEVGEGVFLVIGGAVTGFVGNLELESGAEL